MLNFIWDVNKNEINIKKHNITFQEAGTVFLDEYGIVIHDYTHSENEDRYIIIGLSNKGKVLIVVFTEINQDIRIISSRKATKKEELEYWSGFYGR